METRVREEDETTLLLSSDFCDFEDFGLSTNPERFVSAGSWWEEYGGQQLELCLFFFSSHGSSEVDSDVEDAIYAQMYFEKVPSAVESPGRYSQLIVRC